VPNIQSRCNQLKFGHPPAHVSAKIQGASVRLCNLGKEFHEVMQITKLLTVFDVYDTEAAAVSSFQSVLATSN